MKVKRLSRWPVCALAEQHVGLVDAVDWPVGRQLAADDAGEGREESP